MNNAMLHKVTSVLLLVGGLNWGLVGAFDLNLVETIFTNSTFVTIVYVLVGLSAVYEVIVHRGICVCKTE